MREKCFLSIVKFSYETTGTTHAAFREAFPKLSFHSQLHLPAEYPFRRASLRTNCAFLAIQDSAGLWIQSPTSLSRHTTLTDGQRARSSR